MSANRPPMVRRRVGLAAALVLAFVSVLAPGWISTGSLLALVRVPLESVVVVLILAGLRRPFARRTVSILAAMVFVATIALAALDRGFKSTVGQPFNVVTGWPEVRDAYGVLRDSAGPVASVTLLILIPISFSAVTLILAGAFLRITDAVGRHRRPAAIGGFVIAASWIALGFSGAQVVPGESVAAADTIHTVVVKAEQVRIADADQARFARASATDEYARLPASSLLTGLKGKDVIVAFVESYGQVAVQDTFFSVGVDDVLRRGNAELAATGYQERSAFLTSPTFGGISWLAHSTLQTGLWIDSQQKYDQVTAGNRLTLSRAFAEAGWHTISDVPSDTGPWPIGRSFYHFGTELTSQNVGYQGPPFSYALIPDQYTWEYFQKHELAGPHRPLMAEIDLVSSHTPWTPLPHEVPWTAVGDGSLYDPQPDQGLSPSEVWQNPHLVQQLYGQSVEYSLSTLISFLTTYDNPNLVLVVLGDHQPATVVSGEGANHTVPISIISRDPEVMSRIASWQWQPGMLPDRAAPEWRMDEFRDRFFAAFE
ncbi:CDP-alcohol phosphatidyltransferase [Cryobacterium sp. 10I1]|uniref:CDP-alcohol phosphatidyltransferase n=2 Tax=unclassified Cryobacterium TaxID=2649013 RepID=UPI002B224FDA|nr:CDP-alcohol phosphatidyltransferase [Cryobacterium sp. 10I1]MEB0306886.1 CDP-alcohol phosphatidyltransferase [Cryobacterium sp. 10I1]